MAQVTALLLVPLLTLLLSVSGVISTTFTIINSCDHTVWPGILSNAGVPPISTTGFALQKGESKIITAPTSWGGRLWGRTLCSLDSTGNFTCLTGDCGSGKLECSGFGKPPATLAEFTLDGGEGLDFFDVSLVDGYNLPMLVVPKGGTGQNCTTIGCVTDLNDSCPSELKVTSSGTEGTSVGCKSACEAFGQPQYCCSGAYATPDVCKPSTYSQRFKSACPQAYSYAYDDRTSTFTCASADYTITFCPTPNTSKKASQGQITASTPKTTTTETPSVNSAMIYEGALGESNASPHTRGQVSGSHAIVAALSIALAIWRSWHCRALF
ncbi:hypothetical protein I3843_08G066700 [Carya illinoinensis]|uniref:Thaumatin-like protein 1b n=1 Tax=Carya illinoinensis TaxID=32201 RepID=A0A8T1PNV8_CARIL|nr:thaumatin-like protein 1 [Carya illinoinensis]KAG2692790.1 hypothetical protein I3760_08G068600 [Carya illinoinensis]KAG6644645.1 hypothetical protein CIPAW_08G066900 [Carya illinoinensis]KAG6699463.1 hypothetical protein I3842_08G068400 [Carya illinoinensis]KAG7966790.1 hypothetical protein I3843_08G066700 [Carya illinoinensis]